MRLQLLFEFPFFSNIAMKLIPVEGQTETCSTDGKYLYYDYDFLNEMAEKDRLFVLLHETLHVIQFHHTRKPLGWNDELWNISCDYVVNYLLTQLQGLKLPDDLLYEAKYDNMTPEMIYKLIDKDLKFTKRQPEWDDQGGNDEDSDNSESDNSKSGDSESDSSKSEDSESTPDPGLSQIKDLIKKSNKYGRIMQTKSDPKQEEQQLISEMILAKRMTDKREKTNNYETKKFTLPGTISEQIKQLTSTATPWHSLLSRYFHDIASQDWSFEIPNEDFISTSDVIMPSLYSKTAQEFVIAIDTSGSINYDLLAHFMIEIKKILSDIAYEKVHIIGCADRITLDQTFEKHEEIELDNFDSGGTAFYPVFDLLENRQINPAMLIFFTDLECYEEDHGKDPGFPVVWTTFNNDWKKYFTMPTFGTLLELIPK